MHGLVSSVLFTYFFRSADLRPEAKNFKIFFVHTVSILKYILIHQKEKYVCIDCW